MRNILKVIISSTAALTLLLAGTTNASAQFRYGPMLGVNFSTLHFSQDLVSVKQTTGATAGIQAEMMFPGIGFGLGLGLSYNMLGANINLGDKPVWQSQGFGKERLYLHYINIPLHLRFKWTRMSGLEDYIAPLIFFGPDFNVLAASGNDSAFDTRRLSVAMSTGFGLEIMRRWQLTAAYVISMTNACKTILLDDFHAKSRYWTIRATYYF